MKPKSANEILKEQFVKAFMYAVKMREAELKQSPFKEVTIGRFEINLCLN